MKNKNVTPQSIYFLSIGNSHYKYNEYSSNNYPQLPSASKSAELVAEKLSRFGTGVLLESKENKYLSRCHMFSVLDTLVNMALCSRCNKTNPIFVFYYCGHGITDSNNNVYLVPGDVDSNNGQNELSSYLSVAEIQSYILNRICEKINCKNATTQQIRILAVARMIPRFMFFLDCCTRNESDAGIDVLRKDKVIFCSDIATHKNFIEDMKDEDYKQKLNNVFWNTQNMTVLGGTFGYPTFVTDYAPLANRLGLYFNQGIRKLNLYKFLYIMKAPTSSRGYETDVMPRVEENDTNKEQPPINWLSPSYYFDVVFKKKNSSIYKGNSYLTFYIYDEKHR